MTYDLSLLSKYRTQLMGFAMLWIVYFHITIPMSIPILFDIKLIGYGGVDIFLFVSGIGILFSWKKRPSIKDFFKKRVLRILPSYIFIILFFGLIGVANNQYSISTILYSITSLDILTETWSNLTHWFIPFIIYLYIITPWYLKFSEKKIELLTITIIAICLLYGYVQSIMGINSSMLFISRIPIFFIGIYIGTLLKKDIKLNILHLVISYITMLIGFIMLFYLWQTAPPQFLWNTGLFWYPFILITFPLCILLTQLFELFPNHTYPILTFWGKYSLTIYLLHSNILEILSNNIVMSHFYTNTLAIIITLIAAYITQNIITYSINVGSRVKFNRKTSKPIFKNDNITN